MVNKSGCQDILHKGGRQDIHFLKFYKLRCLRPLGRPGFRVDIHIVWHSGCPTSILYLNEYKISGGRPDIHFHKRSGRLDVQAWHKLCYHLDIVEHPGNNFRGKWAPQPTFVDRVDVSTHSITNGL